MLFVEFKSNSRLFLAILEYLPLKTHAADNKSHRIIFNEPI